MKNLQPEKILGPPLTIRLYVVFSSIPVSGKSFAVSESDSSSGSSWFDSGDAIERGEEIGPGLTLFVQDFAAGGGDFVIASSALAGFFNPSALNPAASFEPIEHRIKRGDVELKHSVGTLFDEFGNFISVTRSVFDQRQNQHFGTSSFDFEIEHILVVPICGAAIYTVDSVRMSSAEEVLSPEC